MATMSEKLQEANLIIKTQEREIRSLYAELENRRNQLQPSRNKDQLVTTLEELDPDDNYNDLMEVLISAWTQAAAGKGKERHANNLPFSQQPILAITRLERNTGGLQYQIVKKVQEAVRLPTYERMRAELYGAINYTAALIMAITEAEEGTSTFIDLEYNMQQHTQVNQTTPLHDTITAGESILHTPLDYTKATLDN